MKKICLMVSLVMLFFVCDLEAKEKCEVNNNVKTCLNTDRNYYYENVYTYQDKSLKKYKQVSLTRKYKKNKAIYSNNTRDYNNAGLLVKAYYFQNDLSGLMLRDQSIVAHPNGKKATVVKNNYLNNKKVYTLTTKFTNTGYQTYYYSINTKNNKITKKISYDTLGKQVKAILNYYDKNNKVSKNITTNYHSDGKKKQEVLKNYLLDKVIYQQTQKYTTKGYQSYYYAIDTKKNKITTAKVFSNVGKVTKMTIVSYDTKNVRVKNNVITYYDNGKKKVSLTHNYHNSKIVTIIEERYRNNRQNSLAQRYTHHYDQNVKRYKRIIEYYHATNFGYLGFSEVKYDVKTGLALTGYRKEFYQNTNKLTYYRLYTYQNGKNIKSVTDYYDYNQNKIKNNETKYDVNGKVISNINLQYVNKLPSLKTGYVYQAKTYQYHHSEYAKGIIKINDITTFNNNSIVKTNYEREYFDTKGVSISKDIYYYTNGEITAKQSTVKKSNLKSSFVEQNYPVKKGLVTASSWHYPASFGGGWHPGIDVGTYSIKDYGYAQPIKVLNDAIVLKRNNSCASTYSSGCGAGFGNYVLVALEYEGKFYTILYAHQTKLDAKNKKHKLVIDQDKKGYKKDEIIGYVGSSGYSSGYHVHIQIQEHQYAKSIEDIKQRFKQLKNDILFAIPYDKIGNNSDIFTLNPDVIYNLKYNKSW